MRHLYIVIFALITTSIFAQGVTPKDWGLKAFHIKDEKLGDINFYVTEKGQKL